MPRTIKILLNNNVIANPLGPSGSR